MPALNHPHTQRLTLENGLTLSVRHEPRLKRCAAVLRVAAGSHDVPGAWPGLAHFLEHLLFLGTERFPAADNLMVWVQRHGGLVNARTCERHTDFFFELPLSAVEGGLERLCDMLGHLRMNMDEQLREREVLHAEFIAWAREPLAQREIKLFQPLNPGHPLRAFHAGNRYSLPVPRASFQQALKDFYQRFYQTGQMTLSLSGPQTVQELIALAEHCTNDLRPAATVQQTCPPALMTAAQAHYQHINEQTLSLMFALEQLPPESVPALDFLRHWINADKAGGLLARLREQQLIDSLKAKRLYDFNGQALLQIEFSAAGDITQDARQIRDTFHDWLAFFSAQQDWPGLREEYRLLQQRQQDINGALELARLDCEQSVPGLSDQGITALKAIVQQMQPVPAAHQAWQLPAPNPFLQTAKEPVSAGLIRGQTSAHRGLRTFAQDRLRSRRDLSAMSFSSAITSHSSEAVIYLRWRLPAKPADTLLPALENSLQSLRLDARHAGVELSLNAVGNDWLLKLQGFHEPMPAILEHALRALSVPAVEQPANASSSATLMPIRQLLKRLPELRHSASEPVINDLQHCWDGARWDGLAVGLPAATQALITPVLNKVPGTADAQLAQLPEPASERRWHTEPCDSSEHALILFCPPPEATLADEATWRLLAQVAQTPFYQRLRVDLQLGYAVFSGLRQINGQTGLLFGVQSPHATTAQIYEHIGSFLEDLPNRVCALDETSFTQTRAALAQQFSNEALGVSQASELLWQAKLAGHPSDYLTALYAALMALDQGTTLKAAEQISSPASHWLCLATSPATETFYPGRS